MKLKICLAIPKFNTGGAEIVVHDLGKELQCLGHDVTIMAFCTSGNSVDRFKESGFKLKAFDFERQPRPSIQWAIKLFKSRKILTGYLRNEQFDVIHSHLMGPDIDTLYAAKSAKIPIIVYTIHSVYRQFASKTPINILKNFRRKRAYRRYDRVYAVDDEVKYWALKWRMLEAKKICTVRNGIDVSRLEVPSSKNELRKQFGWKRDEFVILNVGSLREPKNQLNLVRAVPSVLKEFKNIRLVIAGDGPLKLHLEKEIKMLNLKDKINLLGYRNDVSSLLKAADIFVFPSIWEGLPITLLEALACGTLVAASDIPVHRKILENEKIGFLIFGTEASEISETILFACQRITIDKCMSTLAHQKVLKEYSSKKMADQYLQSYLELFEEKGLNKH